MRKQQEMEHAHIIQSFILLIRMTENNNVKYVIFGL